MKAQIEVNVINKATNKPESIKSEFTPGLLTDQIKTLIEEVLKYDLEGKETKSINISIEND